MVLYKLTGDRIRFARRMVGLTRKKIESEFQISANTLQAWESGKNQLTLKGAKKLNEVFTQLGLLFSENWFLTGNGQAPILMQGVSEIPDEINEDFRILRELEAFKTINPDPIVLIVSDRTMLPLYEIGDYIGGNKKYDTNLKNLIGKNCIVETSRGDILIRKLLNSDKVDSYHLLCLNVHSTLHPIAPYIKIKWAAQIVFHRKKEC